MLPVRNPVGKYVPGDEDRLQWASRSTCRWRGPGRPVVLIHGWPDTKRLWAKQVPALVDAGFQVITYDQRGYGASDKPDEVDAYSIPFLAIDATAILDHLGIERAHFVGHDWGAAVVWAVASLAPDRVDHLVALVGRASRARSPRCRWRNARSRGTCSSSSSRGGRGVAHHERRRELPRRSRRIPTSTRCTRSTSATDRSRPGSTTTARTCRPTRSSVRRSSCRRCRRRRWVCGAPRTSRCWKTQMKNSGEFCANSVPLRAIDGVNHWMQLEAPGTRERATARLPSPLAPVREQAGSRSARP